VDDQLTWQRIEVDGRTASFGVGGDGPPVVFLHGWGLGSRAYRRAIRRLARRGCRVFAPAMPGLGGTAELPRDAMSIGGYADWVDKFMEAVGIEEPALVIGHSFGGGVATKLAHAHPGRVGYLVLLNSVGGATDRPIWGWGMHLAREMLPDREGVEMILAMRYDLVHNVVHNPLGLLRVGALARAADLRVELAELRRRDLPVLALTTAGDGVIPQPAFAALCRAIGTDGQVLTGRHSWLLSHPDSFGEVLGNVLEVRVADHQQRGAETRAVEVADALRSTKIPARTARSMLRGAPPLWLMSAPAPVLAGCELRVTQSQVAGELRAVARPVVDSGAVRLTVVAADRPGLLADTAGAITAHGMSIAEASAATWPTRGLALHALTVHGARDFVAEDWDRLGADLRDLDRSGGERRLTLAPVRATVTVYGAGADRSLVRLTASDQIGLLWAVSDWFARQGVSIECLDASTTDGVAHDVFLVIGPFVASDLSRHLSRGGDPPRLPADESERRLTSR
jgi:pimeloyl-ACP methyl ester carboxylesterase/glycine cleavage system regulatory protein